MIFVGPAFPNEVAEKKAIEDLIAISMVHPKRERIAIDGGALILKKPD